MIDIYFKCDWCNKTVEHKHIEKGNWIFSDDERTTELRRINLGGAQDIHICEDCYNAIQTKIEHLKALSESSGPYRELTDEEKSNFSRYSSANYQDSGVTITCENK